MSNKEHGNTTGGSQGTSSTDTVNVSAKEIMMRLGVNAGAGGYGSKFTNWQDARARANERRLELLQYVPKGSVAADILSREGALSEKQQWVVAYELQKNKKYTQQIAEKKSEAADYAKREAADRAAARERKRERSNAQAQSKGMRPLNKGEKIAVGGTIYDKNGFAITVTGRKGDIFEGVSERGQKYKWHKSKVYVK